MKKTIQTVVAGVIIAVMAGCATPYMTDRGRDAADIFTATVGWGAGAKARVGPVNLGLVGSGDIGGLRGGNVRWYPAAWQGRAAGDLYFLIAGLEVFEPEPRYFQESPCIEQVRRKTFHTTGLILPTGFVDSASQDIRSFSYFTQIDVLVGIGITIRLGFNPGELLDFILGWTTIDMYGDDVGTD